MSNKKILILIAVLTIITVTLIILSLLPFAKKKGRNIPSPTPLEKTTAVTPLPPNFNSVAISTVTYSTEAAKTNTKAFSIGNVIQHLPYKGLLFSLSYDYTNDSFNLIIDKQNASDGQGEFEDYLKQNGITSENDLNNLTTSFN